MTAAELNALPNNTRVRFKCDGVLGTVQFGPMFEGDDRDNRKIIWDDGQICATYGVTDKWCEDLELA